MVVNQYAGRLADPSMLIDPDRLVLAYYNQQPDPGLAAQRVVFGTSGHRGSAFKTSFNEAHILAITQAICRYRKDRGFDGPLFLGRDTHALSEPAFQSALEVLVASGVDVMIDWTHAFTPTPAVSHAILTYNRARREHLGDGIVITPSHNPPEDGGIKYDPPDGGPAGTDVTDWIQDEANRLLKTALQGIRRVPYESARIASSIHHHDYVSAYVGDLPSVIDLEAIRVAGPRLGVDPLGGASLVYWAAIGERYGLDLTIVNKAIDPTFRFVHVDWDGKIRTDCSSPYAMAGLIAMKDRFDVAFGNDADADRHGIVTRSSGLLNPNHYLASAIAYLFRGRPSWPSNAGVGKTLVSSSMIDRVAAELGRRLVEVPVGFKWFVRGLLNGEIGFGGEESAGASFLRRDGSAWSTDKDGILLCLLAAEMTARSGRDPGDLYKDLTLRFGSPAYRRIDARATLEEKEALKKLTPGQIEAREIGGERIVAVLTTAPGNGAPVGGVKVVTENGWFAARPSGTEETYKIYAESFLGDQHLQAILDDAQHVVGSALSGAPARG
jgi:phosphoglucomutase